MWLVSLVEIVLKKICFMVKLWNYRSFFIDNESFQQEKYTAWLSKTSKSLIKNYKEFLMTADLLLTNLVIFADIFIFQIHLFLSLLLENLI